MRLSLWLLTLIMCAACGEKESKTVEPAHFAEILDSYYDRYLEMFPIDATANGDDRYNHLLPATFTDSYGEKLTAFYTTYADTLKKVDRAVLPASDRLSYDILKYTLEMAIRGVKMHVNDRPWADHNYLPFDQFSSLPLTLAQLGAGTGFQPFRTVRDHDKWLERLRAFAPWADSAITYFRRGVDSGVVLPRALVVKMIPQLTSIAAGRGSASLFYGPVKILPHSFPDNEKDRLQAAYLDVIDKHIIPTYAKLASYLENEYISHTRTSSGVLDMPDGFKYYDYLVRSYTTLNRPANQLYYTGLEEVKRLRAEMERVKDSLRFRGSLPEFFNHLRTNRKLMPFRTADEILEAFRQIQGKIEPHVGRLFGKQPKTKFEIRQTEAFRAASSSAEYVQGLPDGSRPGIFYIPITEPASFNITSGMESLFLHEAIPGHHFQVSLQNENEQLPEFRRYLWINSFGEGYALYCESLGHELGLYTDLYQYMGALNDDMHRALRLVIDVGLHHGKLDREEAIRYMMNNESISEEMATAEVERYMAIPGQALSYKAGAMMIRELRAKYERELGSRFNLAGFHDELLKDGCVPLRILESKMEEWAARQRDKR